MPTIEDRVTALESEVERLRAEQDLIVADTAKLPEVIGINFRVFTRNVEHKFDAQERKIDALDARLSVRLDALDAKFDALSSDVAAILKILGRQFGPGA